VDVCSIKRVQDSIKKDGKRFLNRVFTKREIKYCDSKRATRFQHYAARFAAKEAFLKAIDRTKVTLRMKDVEVIRSASGKPDLVLSSAKRKVSGVLKNAKIILSMSHERDVAVSIVILVTLPASESLTSTVF